MFPEYRELITKLKTSDRHFSHLFDKHNQLDQKIQRMEAFTEPGTPEEIETLKKEKYILLSKAAQGQSLSILGFAGVRLRPVQQLLRYGVLVALPQKCVAVVLVLQGTQEHILEKQSPSLKVVTYAVALVARS
jgi:uncharacterized protein YdcH (DUF465 family)